MNEQELLETLIKSMVQDDSRVIVSKIVDDRGTLFTISVSRPDIGRIIGKGGETAKALRTVMRVVGAKSDTLVSLRIEDPKI